MSSNAKAGVHPPDNYNQNKTTMVLPKQRQKNSVDIDIHVSATVTNKTCRLSSWCGWVIGVCIGIALLAVLIALLVVFLQDKAHSEQESNEFMDCEAAYEKGHRTSGVYTISPTNGTRMEVYCEQQLDGGGWTVFQRRINGDVDFFRNWTEYKLGFGDARGEFWLGNDNLNVLTSGRDQRLKIELRWNSTTPQVYADYGLFWTEDEVNKYRLNISEYMSGSVPGDCMQRENGEAFSTYDVDNDSYEAPKYNGDCAGRFKGGWWYGYCHEANLNGKYGSQIYGEGINWRHYTGFYRSLTAVRMMVKKRS